MKTNKIIEDVELVDAGAEGKAIGKSDGLVIFVSHAVPGDIADIEITRKKNKYAEGKVALLKKPSPKRTNPVCTHFGNCGGCKWQNMNYEAQLFFKQKQVTDAFSKIAQLQVPINPILPSANTYNYRNKLEFTFSNKMWLTYEQIKSGAEFNNRNALGFHVPGMFDKVINIEQCHLQGEFSNNIRNEIKKYALEKELPFFDIRNQIGLLRNLIIRNTSTGEQMVIVVFFENKQEQIHELLNHISNQFSSITSLQYIINPKKNDTINDLEVHCFKGSAYITENMEGLIFRISPKSFYQTNSTQAYELYKTAREFADFKGDETVYDLYTGTGTIANFIAKKVKKVTGIEYIEDAVKDAKTNSQINNITNTSFYSGDIKNVLNEDFLKESGKPNIIITDPPRAGMHEDVTRKIMEIAPEKIVYISCNPATQARDIGLLKEIYEVKKVQPVDMFPQTHHVENVALLTKQH